HRAPTRRRLIPLHQPKCSAKALFQRRFAYLINALAIRGVEDQPKDRPTHLPVRYDEGPEQKFVPVEDHPIVLVMPRFSEPGILRGMPPSPGIRGRLEAYADHVAVRKVAARHAASKIHVDGKFNIAAFALMLAKIAHGFAWVTVGEGGFRPYLPDLIRLKNLDLMSYLVGEAPRFVSMQRSPVRDNLMTVVLQPCLEGHVVLVGIKLFAAFPSPTYCVAAGKFIPSQEILDRLGLSLSESHVTRASRLPSDKSPSPSR